MADQKPPKRPVGSSSKDEPFRPLPPLNTEPNLVGFDAEAVDLSELDGLFDEVVSDFPVAEGAAAEPAPLPPPDDVTDSQGLLESAAEDPRVFESPTAEGYPGAVTPAASEALDAAVWEEPSPEDVLSDVQSLAPPIVSSTAAPLEDGQSDEEARLADEVRREEDARQADEARLADEVRREEDARQADEARQAEAQREAEAHRQAEITRRADEARLEREAQRATPSPDDPEPTLKTAARPAARKAPEPRAVEGAVDSAAEAAAIPPEFRRESQRLARARDWKKLAELTAGALDQAWAAAPELRATLLADLGRIQRDRLADPAAAEKSFAALVRIEPAHVDGFAFLAEAYEGRGAWRELYDLHLAAVEATWDPNERLKWTRRAVQIAEERLLSAELSVEAWERLAKLGDAVEETTRALTDAYRSAGRWDRLTDFLERAAEQLTGAERRLQLREVVEACLSGLRDPERAHAVLERILAERPEDRIALLMHARVEARRRQWDSLFTLGMRPPLDGPNKKADATTTNDLRRIAADALAAGGQHDRAAEVYDLILRERPGDRDAVEAKERYLAQSGRVAELVDFLAVRATRAPDAERAKLLERAAQIAEHDLKKPERAVELWNARAEVPAGRLDALRALAGLYQALGDDDGLRHALEGQLRLVQSVGQRIELLRALGRHAAHRLGDDGLAERCWGEILRAVPDDRDVREELNALHRRRGDFAALDRALNAQAWRPASDGDLGALWRAAAENLEANLLQSGRAGAAWRRVLDLQPEDHDALAAIVRHERVGGGDGRGLIFALEAQLRALGASASAEQRAALATEIAARWEAIGDDAAATAAYERILWWAPDDANAIEHLLELRLKEGTGTSAALIDHAAVLHPDAAATQTLVRAQIDLVPPDDALGRFYAWRRLSRVAGAAPEIVAQLTATAKTAGAHAELEAVLVDLAASAPPETRREHHEALARLYEEQLRDPVRALLARTTARHESVASLDELEPALRLCDATGRHEDAYALLGVATRAEVPEAQRFEAVRRRARLAEEKLADPERAFYEHVRLLAVDTSDARALEAAQRLARERKLSPALDALYGELRDRAHTTKDRVAITRLRYELRAGALDDHPGALDEAWLLYHLAPTAEHEELLFKIATAQGRWGRALAVVEARARAGVSAPGLVSLQAIGELHDRERKDGARALELAAAALLGSTDADEQRALEATIERLAASTSQGALEAEALRAAASRALDVTRALRLYRRVAAVYSERLGQPGLALDVYRRILHLDPNDPTALEVAIERLRADELWRDLRDTIQHWVEVARDADRATLLERQLEIATISRDRLSDPERALATYATVLELDPASAPALDGIASLTGGAMTPELEVRRLRLELGRADADRRVELTLRVATLYETTLDDRGSAITALRDLVRESGAGGPAFAPLRRLLEAEGAWVDVVELLEAHATAVEGEARARALDDALAIAEAHLREVGIERCERLCRRLVEARPDDVEARRRLHSLLREGNRWAELADRLEESLKRLGDPEDDDDVQREERGLVESELSHLLERNLGKPGDAGALLLAQLERRPARRDAALELAGVKLRTGDVAGYVTLRQEHARSLRPSLAAYVLCHLAEAIDERIGDPQKVLDLYRAARALDANNPAAMDALKAVGRRAKSWRSGAALLPDPDERELSWPERSRRLQERAAAVRATDPAQARTWLERAIATDPDNHTAWIALAELAQLRHDAEEAIDATRSALFAFVRAAAGDADRQAEHAGLVLAYAAALRARGDATLAARLAWRAYELRPSLPAAALQVGSELLQQGRRKEAYAIYDRLLGGATPLAAGERLEATFRRGALRAQLGDHDAAIADFREGLRIEELHPPLLSELAQVLVVSGRVASAALHYAQALLLSSDRARRADLYARLGRLFDGALADEDEAGVCFDRAMGFGSTDPQIMLRALGHYRRRGEVDRALGVLDRILPSTTHPPDLAALWAERGRLLAERDPDKAIEAFDMALSYDSACTPAVQGLAAVLEARGDWKQLLELLEVRAEQGAPAERADAMRGLARIAAGHLGDQARAEGYLREAIVLAPQREDYEQLLKIVGDDPARRAERRDVIASLLAMGGPLLPRVIELGRELVSEGKRHWAWTLLSPLMNTTLSEPSLKSIVLELRKEFEKAETVARLSPRTHLLVRALDVPTAIFDLLAAADALGPIGPASLEGVTLGKLDARTAVGKTFLALADRLGIENAGLFRAQELPTPFQLLDSDTPQVVLRADLVQLMAPGETNYLFTLALEHARLGARIVTALPAAERPHLVAALLDVLGLATAPPEALALRDRVAQAIPPERRAELAAKVADLDRALLTSAQLSARVAEVVVETARRVALVAAADLRFPAKVLTRLDDTLPKLPSAGKLDDLEDFLAGAAPLRALFSFAASSQFARALES